MPEALSPLDVHAAITEHTELSAHATRDDKRDWWLTIAEAVLLSLVAVLAAYSGFAAAKFSTESTISLAKASTERTQASRADSSAIVTRTLDSASFNAWFTAFTLHDKNAERIALGRLRPGYHKAFTAWLATDPAHNRHAPPGPAYMKQYSIPQEAVAKHFDRLAEASFDTGERTGGTSDDYIRDTVFLATVLFLVGISSHFRLRTARYGLVCVGTCLLVFAVVQILSLQTPS